MQYNCINLSYQVLITWIVLLYCHFFSLNTSSSTHFDITWISSLASQLSDCYNSVGKVWAQQQCLQVKVLGSFQDIRVFSADISHLCEMSWCWQKQPKYMHSRGVIAVIVVSWQWMTEKPSSDSLVLVFIVLGTGLSLITKCCSLYWGRPKQLTHALQSMHLSLEAKHWVDKQTANCLTFLKI